MSDRDRKRLREIHTFPALVKYLREDLGWPVEQGNFADLDEITFDWEADELGIDPDQAAKIEYIKQLRPLENGEPQGVFFVKFNAKSLPVVALRRLLSKLVIKKRATATAAERPLWAMRDLVFISSFGSSEERQLSFAYFQESEQKTELPTLKVLGWDDRDTALHLDRVHDLLTSHLTWPANTKSLPVWRKDWSKAFELRHGQVVSTAKELAEQLASLARGIRERANQLLRLETAKGPLRILMSGFKAALIHDLTDDQFADMYAQTIAYGLLSARITHPDSVNAETLPDLIPVTNPFLKELMETFVVAAGKHRGRKKGLHLDFDELGINEVVELLRRANMDAVLRNFGARDRREDPVTYFYEDFLNAYDSKERKRRGVYYTPKPIVSYIVRSAHESLRTEFGIEDGLASTITWGEMAVRVKGLEIPPGVAPDSAFVQLLDPATGTATFLIEVIDVVFETLKTKWRMEGLADTEQLAVWNEYVPKHLLSRLYGYELMMAPYAIAHLKIGLKLYETGYRFQSEQRAQVYLTNALEPASDAAGSQIDALSDALARESASVNAVKRGTTFTLVVGNPPYSSVSANMGTEHRRIIDEYRSVDGVRIKERGALQLEKNLQDDYVKFIRLAQVTCDRAPMSVLGFISNHAYIDNPTLRGLRCSLMGTFNDMQVLDLHGNSKRREHCPLSEPDENVFDIQQGVCILLASKTCDAAERKIAWGELWGSREAKYTRLLSAVSGELSTQTVVPVPPNYLFLAQDDALVAELSEWTPIDQIFTLYSTGVATARDALTVQLSRAESLAVTREFYELPAEKARERFGLGPDTNDWKIKLAQADLKRTELAKEWEQRYQYRPFDVRYTFYTGQPRGFLCNPRWPVMKHLIAGPNLAFCCAKSVETGHAFAHTFVTRAVADHHSVSLKEVNYIFPALTYSSPSDSPAEPQRGLFSDQSVRAESNLSGEVQRRLFANLGLTVSEHGAGLRSVEFVEYMYAVLHSPSYRSRYASFLRKGFARIPVGGDKVLFDKLKRLGCELIGFHLLENSTPGQSIATYSGPANPEVGRIGWSNNTVWLNVESVKKAQGAGVGTIGFNGVPEAVWNFHVGGYQVCEKWLKDRKGRKLRKLDIEHYQRVVMAISETIRLMKEIDKVIEGSGGWPAAFQTGRPALSRL